MAKVKAEVEGIRETTMRLIAFAATALFLSTAAAMSGPLEDLSAGIKATRQGRLEEALRLLGRAISSRQLAAPNRAAAHANRCLALVLLGRPGRALPDCTQAILLRPRLVEAHINRGMAFRQLGRYDDALRDYSRALELRPGFLPALLNRAYVQYRAGRLARARADYESVIKARGALGPAHGGRGLVFFGLGGFARAAEDFARAARLTPGEPLWPLWAHTAARRGGRRSMLAAAARRWPPDAWPGPLYALFLGNTTAPAVLTRAGADDQRAPPAERCQALFFVAQYLLLRNRPKAAAQILERLLEIRASDVCDHAAARYELARLRPSEPKPAPRPASEPTVDR